MPDLQNLKEACDYYQGILKLCVNAEPKEFPSNQAMPSEKDAYTHCLWLLEEHLPPLIGEGEADKVFAGIVFVQTTLWNRGMCSLDSFKLCP